MAKVSRSTPDGEVVPEWVAQATAEEGAGYERADGALGENGLFRFKVTLRPNTDTALVEVYIADGEPEAQLDLLNQVHSTIDTMINALEAQIGKAHSG